MPFSYRSDMELRQLRYFVAVADELGFTKAARKIRVAQPALSRQIRQLENELGVVLLERTARKVALTPAGKSFLAEARSILAQSANAVRVAKSAEVSGQSVLNIGYAWGLFHTLVPQAIARFHRQVQNVAVNLFDMTAPQQTAALLEGRLDAGFIGFAKDAAAPELVRRKIGACSLMVALPEKHPAARRKTVDLRNLSHDLYCVISDESFPGAAKCAMDACAAAGFRPRVLETAARGNIQLGLVAANCGIALMPEPLAALPHPGVIFRPLSNPPVNDLFIAWNSRRSMPVCQTFLNSVTPSVNGAGRPNAP